MRYPESLQQYPLNKNSMVFIAGGWSGAQAKYYADHYDPRIHVFEPQKEVAEGHLAEMFSHNPKVHIHSFGLGIETGIFKMARVGSEGCSFEMRKEGIAFEEPHAMGELIEVGEFLKANQIKKVDFALLNMEGYEFKLLPWLVANGLIDCFNYLMVQFHLPYDANDQLPAIRDMMAATHDIRDDYEPQWISWQRRENINAPIYEAFPVVQIRKSDGEPTSAVVLDRKAKPKPRKKAKAK